MNKQTLVKAVAETTELTQKQVTQVLEALVATITATLVTGEEVRITDLGTFTVADTAARTGRNPKTGEALEIAASKRVAFKASSVLKGQVKGV